MLVPGALWAQAVATTSSVDLNGNRVSDYSIATAPNGEATQVSESINGQLVPKEQSQTRVLSDSPDEKVTESIDRKYNQTGQLISTQRTITTERKTPGGGSSTNATVYSSDVNGNMLESEHRLTETHPTGPGATESEVTIARPSLNGAFQTVERRKTSKFEDKTQSHEEQTAYQRSNSGDLVETRRMVSNSQKLDDKTEEQVANYEVDYAGRMVLLNSEKNTTTVSKDGKQVVERSLYGPNALGVVRTDQDGQKIREQNIIVRTPGPDGSVKETVSARRPVLSDPTQLGPPIQISETVCTGKCEPGKP